MVESSSTNRRNISATERNEIEAAIREVFDTASAAWNRGDLDGYLGSYWDSDRTIWISNGSLTRGRKAIEAAYRSRFQNPQQVGKLTVTELEIDVLTTRDATALGRWMLVMDDGESSTGFFTVQLKKIDRAWLFVSDHSSSEGAG